MITIQLPPDFKEFLRLLSLNQVEYLLIGGYAVGYHGYPRATADMDIDECYKSRIEDEIDGVKVNIIDIKHLRIKKKASGRHKDLNDLEHLTE